MKVYTSCTNAGPISVYVQDGKVVRIRPLVADDKDFKPWTIEAGGQRYSPEKKFNVAPYVLTERNRLYSKDRILTPMKRVDFDPNGKRNQQNRGKSGYEPISWDEALGIVAGEIKRVQGTYGPSALTAMTSSHHNWGLVGYKISAFQRFFNLIGYTTVMDNPDSWEGWHWGATHTYGFYWRLGMPEPYDMLEDALKHTEMIVYWSNDPDTTRGVYTGQDSAIWRRWLKEKGVKMVFIDPYYNSTAAAMGGKWLAPRPGTDTALAMAIAYHVDQRRHLRQAVRRGPHARLRGIPPLRHGRGRWRAEDAGLGGGGIRRAGAGHRRARPRLGAHEDDARRRCARRRGRRLPPGLRHGMGADDGAAAGHAGPGQARHRHLGHGDGRAAQQRRLLSGLR